MPQANHQCQGFQMMSQTVRTIPSFLILTMFSALWVSGVQAQDPFRLYKDFDRYRYLPRTMQQTDKPQPLPETPGKVEGDPTTLVKELKAIVVVDHPDRVPEPVLEEGAADADAKPEDKADPSKPKDKAEPSKPEDKADPSKPKGMVRTEAAGAKRQGKPFEVGEKAQGLIIDPQGRFSFVRTPQFACIAQKYLGGEISLRQLNEMARDIVLLYRKNDRPVVDVAFPEQDITTGVLYMVITEGRIGKICVDGACYFDNQVLRDQLWLCPEQPICESQLMDELEWLYRNPYRTVDMELTPGQLRGQTDVMFHVKDQVPARVYAGYEDTGTRATQLERMFVGVNWNNVFNIDDTAGYQYTTSPQAGRLSSHSMFYTHALHNRDVLAVYGNVADYEARVLGLTTQGQAHQVLLRWNRRLDPIDKYEHNLTAGVDWKQASRALEFGPGLVFGGTFDVFQLNLGYQGSAPDDYGQWSFSVDGYFSPGNVTNHNDTPHFTSVRANSDANYVYTRGLFERRVNGPWETEFVGRVTGQWAGENLVPTEQLGFGGYNSIRGYDQFAVLGDSGYFVNAEWWTPKFPIGGSEGDEGQLRGLVFYDYGNSYNHKLLPGEGSSVDLQSAGLGFRYSLKSNIQVRFDYGWQLTDLGTDSYHDRVQLGAVLSY